MQLVDAVLKRSYSQASINLILNQPEIEAIPIEWIKKYYEDITMPYTDTRIQFEEMIRKWEKENGKQD